MSDVHIQISKILKKAQAEIKKIDAGDFEQVKARAAMTLNRMANEVHTTNSLEDPLIPTAKPEPLTEMFGRKFYENASTKEVDGKLTEVDFKDEKVQELKNDATELYNKFTETDNAGILDTYSQTEILAVAKMAGLMVDEHKKVTNKYITEIKEAIAKKAELESIGK